MTQFVSFLRLRALPLCVVFVLSSCGPAAEPVYDDELGLQAVPIAEGSLSGTFALKVVAASLVRIPIPGIDDQLGGGVNYRLVQRQWDAEQGLSLIHISEPTRPY